MLISIQLLDENGELIAKRETENWDIAEQNFNSLKDFWQKEQFKAEQKLVDLTEYEQGDCQNCGEPLNNAEGYLCFKCKVAEKEQ